MKTQFTEAIKLKDGKIHNLNYHQARINRTLEAFGGGEINLTEALTTIPDEAKYGLVKSRILYSDVIENIDFIPYVFRTKTRVGVISADDLEYSFKYADREKLESLQANTDFDDLIILKKNLVTDAIYSNLVFENKEGLFTPESFLLAGTKRQFLLDTGKIQERKIRKRDIKLYEKIYFINALIDLEDNISIETKHLIFQ